MPFRSSCVVSAIVMDKLQHRSIEFPLLRNHYRAGRSCRPGCPPLFRCNAQWPFGMRGRDARTA
ncbi:hypothetical protein SL1157_1172 [Ruegeria lacuscaerulensis ITI-1157]|nr:hypothetical protein SL1157_1172 [Ruegeria lacuscaerulensis ITI-1157]